MNDVDRVITQLLARDRVVPTQLCAVHHPGLYAWWDPAAVLSDLWPPDFPEVPSDEPIYVGIANQSFAQRFGEMHFRTQHPTRWSGLRRSLAALLCDELDLLAGATAGKGLFAVDGVDVGRASLAG